jgi:purine-nucleoside phosphorylase
LRAKLDETVAFLRGRTKVKPEVALILGSGLGPLADRIESPVRIPYEEIPHFPRSTVEGHSGLLVFGKLAGRPVVALKGRFHPYEGWSPERVVYATRTFRHLGIRKLIVSNAAGGVNRSFRIGDLMIIDDFVNFQFVNPLIGRNEDWLGGRFPDISRPFSTRLQGLAEAVALEAKVPFQRGVYWANMGPTYETRAELRAMGQLGADAVGMSTVPEVIAAIHCGFQEILGISCITNLATGDSAAKPTHQEVLDVAKRAEQGFCTVVEGVLARMGRK